MERWSLATPVALFLFNRPDTTARVFEAVRRARPPRLLLVADGPRPGRPGEAEACRAARAVVERVDWPCLVQTRFSEENLGCRRRLSSGLDWVFAAVEEAIVLEDDCLPHPTFFRYCEELLARHRADERVMAISGTNYHLGRRFTEASYFASRYPHVWGWASWRRAWRRYDVAMRGWPAARDGGWPARAHPRPLVRRFFEEMFEGTHAGRIDTWDYQWVFAVQASGGVSLTPAVNLISNIGFGAAATKTTRKNRWAELPAAPMTFPLVHPPDLAPLAAADRATEDAQHLAHSLQARLLRAWWKVRRGAAGLAGAGRGA